MRETVSPCGDNTEGSETVNPGGVSDTEGSVTVSPGGATTTTEGSETENPGGDTKLNLVKISPEPINKMSDAEKGKTESVKSEGWRPTVKVPHIEDFTDFETWTKCVFAWSKTCNIPKGEQGFWLCQELPISSKRYGKSLREDVYKKCPPDTLVDDEKGG